MLKQFIKGYNLYGFENEVYSIELPLKSQSSPDPSQSILLTFNSKVPVSSKLNGELLLSFKGQLFMFPI